MLSLARALALSAVVFTAACGGSTPARTETAPSVPIAKWARITVRSARIAPALENGSPWDPDAAAARAEDRSRTTDGVAQLLGLVNGRAGLMLAALSALAPLSSADNEASPSLPDPYVEARFTDGGHDSIVRTRVVHDSAHPEWRASFLVHGPTLRGRGIVLVVREDDGEAHDAPVIGETLVPADRIANVLATGSADDLDLSDHELETLRVSVEPFDAGASVSRSVHVSLDAGLSATDLDVPAGAVVTVRASGHGRIGSGFCGPPEVDALGVSDGRCRDYNLRFGSLPQAPHGVAIVLHGSEPRIFAAAVLDPDRAASCVRFRASETGPLVVGINDHDPSNNTGAFDFEVSYRAPIASEETRPLGESWTCGLDDDFSDGRCERECSGASPTAAP